MNALSVRSAGWLLHPTSLGEAGGGGGVGCGDIGPGARAFVDVLGEAGVRWWQMLPTHPIGNAPGYSPYSAVSAFAMSPLLASGDDLVETGLLSARVWKGLGGETRGKKASRRTGPARGGWRADYPVAIAQREEMLRAAYGEFVAAGGERTKQYQGFEKREAAWLGDWAVFAALRGAPAGAGGRKGEKKPTEWWRFAKALAAHEPGAVARYAAEHAEEVGYHRFVQWVLDEQWGRLREYAAGRGVLLMGDVPIFVSHDSADVWGQPGLWELDAKGRAERVSGYPPDAFSKKGQLWGHPQYRWGAHRAEKFAWWVRRFEKMLTLFDGVRIDHFLGFNQVWSVDGRAKDATKGRWVEVPGREIFGAIKRRLPGAAIVAEDLGLASEEATRLREAFGFPGMRVMQFGFAGGEMHLPYTYVPNCIAYTGTHDNATAVGWYASAGGEEKRKAKVLGIEKGNVAEEMVRQLMASVANTVVFPVQDVLGLGAEHRMNVPGTEGGNWEWRLGMDVPGAVVRRFRELTEATGRKVSEGP